MTISDESQQPTAWSELELMPLYHIYNYLFVHLVLEQRHNLPILPFQLLVVTVGIP